MNLKDIEKIINLLEKSQLDLLEIKDKDFSIKLSKHNKNVSVVSNNSREEIVVPVVDKVESVKEVDCFKAPLVGTFYAKPSPDAKNFVSINQQVQEGEVICIIEAMKVMNEIKATKSGMIKKILVEDGIMVEYDQPLFEIE